MYEDYTVLTLGRWSISVVISFRYWLYVCCQPYPVLLYLQNTRQLKVRHSWLCTYQRDYIVTCRVSNRSRGLYRMLPWLSLASCKLFHMARCPYFITYKLYLHGKKYIEFPHKVLLGTTCLHACRSEIINERYRTSRLS